MGSKLRHSKQIKFVITNLGRLKFVAAYVRSSAPTHVKKMVHPAIFLRFFSLRTSVAIKHEKKKSEKHVGAQLSYWVKHKAKGKKRGRVLLKTKDTQVIIFQFFFKQVFLLVKHASRLRASLEQP